MSPKSKILSLLDLTSLNDSDTPAVIDALCNNAQQPIGKAAAVCVYPQFVAQARQRLPESLGIGVATVVNFPSGDEPLDGVLAQTQQALDDGANEIDLVLPYKKLQSGDTAACEQMVSQTATLTHQHSGSLKVILETGALTDAQIIQAAQTAKISGGVRDIATAQAYIDQAAAKMGEGWVRPENFRIGASSLLNELV